MLNKYPLWKYLLILAVLVFGVVYALPNLYPDDPALQISTQKATSTVDERTLKTARNALDKAGIELKAAELTSAGGTLRFDNGEDQLAAKPVIAAALGDGYVTALNLVPTTPDWLASLGAGPAKLGLDLRGGVHFLLEVDTPAALKQRLEVAGSEMKAALRKERIRYRSVEIKDGVMSIRFLKDSDRDLAESLLKDDFGDYLYRTVEDGKSFFLTIGFSEAEQKEIEAYALEQNLTTLRNRVNELGVAEPLVQRQGSNRIVVELPGVQDTAAAKRIIGATANLEFRLEAGLDANASDTETLTFRNGSGRTAQLEKDIIITGDSVSDANSSFDENGRPQVNISLDSKGGKQMAKVTRSAVGRNMAVVFIEHKSRSRFVEQEDGSLKEVRRSYSEKGIISLATIQTTLGNSFRITGLDSPRESSELALLLRAGALAAPIYFVEERTIGPSLGAENIKLGVTSAQIGMLVVMLFMLIYYKVFGVFANVSLILNIVLLMAFMSLMSATLTLPGIAGIVLTMGMAVDANVLIFSRIKEELANGLPSQQAIHSGFNRAFTTIFDANITTLLVAVILFAVGTGPVKGFAVTLSLGILTSMFTAIVVTRAQVNLVYGGRKNKRLYI
ncbi:protein translocase subunit SecD [Marinomonas mediterranea]|jgi:protein-export membrane protein, SecD/SecF family/protein-export membrane protein SecD|uniref:Protein translocase subunit SecD n=1 Tax=Marinomonas mediterranea (strain ATCC 700492 / JCM 21426 / NBRC 103028 / MMB-1) TaxID=717774 RepID=F2JYV3_MARM1|nr:protein translocase subunit SecD [Marinomonas mediterranea]ADZ90818.1 protein-export membrane protein SecD [Marinomonas mediterranea MMB-1]WCN08857.1 protein translocase subunit SecD [Marinomonas mediterranea]WCN16970.1 protein translocase subunit SecD [Marinomonas mediterranea MMB-1]